MPWTKESNSHATQKKKVKLVARWSVAARPTGKSAILAGHPRHSAANCPKIVRVNSTIRQNSGMKSFVPARRLLRLLCSLWLSLPLLAFALGSQTPLHKAVEDYLRMQTHGLPGKVSYRITPLDRRTQLSPCDAFEPFLPSGGAPWGRTTIGVRCLGPSAWTIYMQVQVSIHAKYLVAARPLTAGQIIGANDFVSRTGDLGLLPATILMDAEQAIGKTLKIGIAAGQALRGDQLIAPWAVQQGQNVKTISRGTGFSVSSEGRALNNAVEGQMVQVRTPSGQTVSGIARTGGIVEVNY